MRAPKLGPVFTRRARIWLWVCAVAQLTLLFGLAAARYHNVHQRTFDLALYARLAWGFAHGDVTTPVLGMAPLGTHISPLLWPLAALGRLFSTVHVLLFAQALCVSLCVFPIARIGARHMGKQGLFLALFAWLLYPNLCHVVSYEFHPGTLAVLPICWAFDALERGNLRHLSVACAAILCCREDLFLMCVIFAFIHQRRFGRRAAWQLLAACALYGVGALWVVMKYAPANGSFEQHFGVWGGSPLGLVRTLFTEPARVIAHLRAPEKAWYVPRLLACLSFFPLRALPLLAPAAPYLALNLLSAFPTTTQQYSHYLTPCVPALVVAGVVGVTSVRQRGILGLWILTLGISHYALGGSPLSRDIDRSAFRADESTLAARAVLAAIPADVSVQAPDPLLPHLAERARIDRAPPPLRAADYVVLDVSHRQRFARQEALLRTSEEPFVRGLLARADYALLVYAPPYALLQRGKSARTGAALHAYLVGREPLHEQAAQLTPCLRVLSAALREQTLVVTLQAQSVCSAELALRLSDTEQHGRADLLCAGALSPALLQTGDVFRSEHVLSKKLLAAARAGRVWLSTVRADGKQVVEGDPVAVPIDVRQHGAP